MNRNSVKKKAACVAATVLALSMTVSTPLGVLAQESTADTTTTLVNLETEGKSAPLGIDTQNPVFSWQMISDVTGASQKNYQIVVSQSDGTQVWDSGKVDSDSSLDIAYEGEALEPCTVYNWTLTVEDNSGNTLTSQSTFETSKLSTELDAWNGAKWIGADELSLNAASTTLFDITTKVQIPEGSNKASVIFGANDFRYNNKLYNLYQLEGENYFRAELDVTNAGTEEGAAINIYRVGFFPEDTPDQPYMTINLANNPTTNLNELITAENKNEQHELELSMSTCTLRVSIDGTAVITGETENAFTGEKSPSSDIVLADWGNSDVMSVPNLNSIGFAADAGETAVFTDFELQNPSYGTGTVFGQNIGATYAIWDGKDGITVDQNSITVTGGENGTLSYADPSYGSEPYVRTSFEAKENIASARLYLAFQGIGNFYINGQEVAADEWFKQGSMEYREEIGYNVYDVTDYVTSGSNAMGAVMGEGWWTGHPQNYDDSLYNYYGDKEALLANLVITYEDGSTDVITSDDNTWQYYGQGPVKSASIFEGETYDATAEAAVENFSSSDYDAEAAGWRQAEAIETRKAFADQDLIVRDDDEVHVIRELDATLVGETKEGSSSYIYDFGENVAAVPQITIPAEYAKEGETITVRVA